MKSRLFVCATVLAAALGAGEAWAGSVTGTGYGSSHKQACDEAKANARSLLPAGAKVKTFSECLCRGRSSHTCTISAEY